MIRLNLVVEGQTEEVFARHLLAPHLATFGVFATARCAQTGKKRGTIHRGGVVNYAQFLHDLVVWMRQDKSPEAYFSTMVDLYRLPSDFPGYLDASKAPTAIERVEALESTFRAAVAHPTDHFIPHIQPHEFEALLLACPGAFELRFPDRPKALSQLAEAAGAFPSPEDINEDEPPSKRILALFPAYSKVEDGLVLSTRIGLPAMRGKCLHFDQWLRRLEALGR